MQGFVVEREKVTPAVGIGFTFEKKVFKKFNKLAKSIQLCLFMCKEHIFWGNNLVVARSAYKVMLGNLISARHKAGKLQWQDMLG